MKRSKTTRSRWGLGVASLYGGFVVFVLALVAFASLQRFHMVESNYYEKELVYQQQIDRTTRANTLPTRLAVQYEPSSDRIVLQFPEAGVEESVSGRIVLFRPSDRHLDKELVVQTDRQGRQYISTSGLARGLWRLKTAWARAGIEYYHEEILVLE
jgi:nitrogen fixation protein FixH